MLADHFIVAFGQDLHDAIMAAAKYHEDKQAALYAETGMIYQRKAQGSDLFRDALVRCIGWQCFDEPERAVEHKINPEALPAIKKWAKEFARIDLYDGEPEYLALLAGVYMPYVPELPVA